LAACAVIGAMSSRDFADAQDAQQLQDQMHVLQQQMQD
jgi:hypothetical protein